MYRLHAALRHYYVGACMHSVLKRVELDSSVQWLCGLRCEAAMSDHSGREE